ncbi:MAG: hypothetical protein ABSH13_07530 [Candidatus Acidiferrum sp.]|jgi:hypothetical protein
MLRRGFSRVAVVCALALSSFMVAAPAQAQEQTHYTFVSYWAVPRAQWTDFEKAQEQTAALLEHLVADGTLVAWGSSAALVHTEDGYTHASWFVSTTQSGLTKTLEALRTASRSQALAGTTKHEDLMLHSIAHGGKTARATSGIIRVSYWRAKPGRGDDLESFFKKYIQPDLDAGVADGSILMYNFDSEVIHTDAPGGYNLAVVYANGDGLDKASALLAAHAKESPAVGEGFASMLVIEAHRDSLGRVLAYQHK